MEETVSGIQVASVLICGISEFKKSVPAHS